MSNHDREGKGDATLDRAWRQASDEVASAKLDAAIVQSARKAIQDRDDAVKVIRTGRRPRHWPTGWQPLAAAAGIAGLAFILVQSLPRDRDGAPSIRMEESVPGRTGAPESLSGPSAGEARAEKSAAATVPASPEAPVAAPGSDQTKQTVPPPPPVPAFVPRAASVAGAMDEDAPADDTAVRRAAEADQLLRTVPEMPSPAASAAAAATARERSGVAPLSAEDWAARVVALHASGDVRRAADTLRGFRVAVPDADTYLPESLSDWARTIE